MDTIETWSIHNMPRLNDPQGAIVYCRDLYNSCLGSSIVVHGTIYGANKRFYWGFICGKGGLSMAATLGPGDRFWGDLQRNDRARLYFVAYFAQGHCAK